MFAVLNLIFRYRVVRSNPTGLLSFGQGVFDLFLEDLRTCLTENSVYNASLQKPQRSFASFALVKNPRFSPILVVPIRVFSFALLFLSAEAGVRRCSTKLVILKISQNLQENICAGVIF